MSDSPADRLNDVLCRMSREQRQQAFVWVVERLASLGYARKPRQRVGATYRRQRWMMFLKECLLSERKRWNAASP